MLNFLDSILRNTLILYLAIIIGFDQNQYSITESTSSVPIMIQWTNGNLSEDIVVTMSTVDITADCKLRHMTFEISKSQSVFNSLNFSPVWRA